MSALLAQVENAIRVRHLFHRGESIMVAVSGGLDSMVLLEVLRRLSTQTEHQWRLVVAHFNHRLRGNQSEADEALVRAIAARNQMSCVVGAGEVKQKAEAEGWSVEMAARHLRHDFFARTAHELSIATVALAHHVDDQAELFFLRLFRGAGTEGLAGMKWKAPSPAAPDVAVARPLLGQSKQALAEFAAGEGILFREDESNADCGIERNRIRHELIPLLSSEYQPALHEVIFRQMEILGAENEFLEETVQGLLQAENWPEFGRLHVAVQRRLIQLQLLQFGLQPDFTWIEQLRLAGDRALTLAPSLIVRRLSNGRLQKEPNGLVGFNPASMELDLNENSGEGTFGSLHFSWQLEDVEPRNADYQGEAGCEYFDADKVGPMIQLRHWQPGDRFQPSGLGSPAKLQDLFTNLRIPRADRRMGVLGTNRAGEIWWVEGLRISEGFKVRNETIRRLRWCWKRTS